MAFASSLLIFATVFGLSSAVAYIPLTGIDASFVANSRQLVANQLTYIHNSTCLNNVNCRAYMVITFPGSPLNTNCLITAMGFQKSTQIMTTSVSLLTGQITINCGAATGDFYVHFRYYSADETTAISNSPKALVPVPLGANKTSIRVTGTINTYPTIVTFAAPAGQPNPIMQIAPLNSLSGSCNYDLYSHGEPSQIGQSKYSLLRYTPQNSGRLSVNPIPAYAATIVVSKGCAAEFAVSDLTNTFNYGNAQVTMKTQNRVGFLMSRNYPNSWYLDGNQNQVASVKWTVDSSIKDAGKTKAKITVVNFLPATNKAQLQLYYNDKLTDTYKNPVSNDVVSDKGSSFAVKFYPVSLADQFLIRAWRAGSNCTAWVTGVRLSKMRLLIALLCIASIYAIDIQLTQKDSNYVLRGNELKNFQTVNIKTCSNCSTLVQHGFIDGAQNDTNFNLKTPDGRVINSKNLNGTQDLYLVGDISVDPVAGTSWDFALVFRYVPDNETAFVDKSQKRVVFVPPAAQYEYYSYTMTADPNRPTVITHVADPSIEKPAIMVYPSGDVYNYCEYNLYSGGYPPMTTWQPYFMYQYDKDSPARFSTLNPMFESAITLVIPANCSINVMLKDLSPKTNGTGNINSKTSSRSMFISSRNYPYTLDGRGNELDVIFFEWHIDSSVRNWNRTQVKVFVNEFNPGNPPARLEAYKDGLFYQYMNLTTALAQMECGYFALFFQPYSKDANFLAYIETNPSDAPGATTNAPPTVTTTKSSNLLGKLDEITSSLILVDYQ
ncbi:unnamed protein product, partial [Mesorhabditis spiculigera]